LRSHLLAIALVGLVFAPHAALSAPPKPAIKGGEGVVEHVRQAERERARKPARPGKRAASRRSAASKIPLMIGIGY
jgi:hypothetical protein